MGMYRITRRHRWLAFAVLVAAVVRMLTGSVTLATAATATTRTYYISATGDDAANGLSVATAWRSLQRVNMVVFHPGDRLLLQGGASFPGSVYLDAADAGDAQHPVVIGSYGAGRARIIPIGTTGIFVYNTAGVDVRNLVLTGDATDYRRESGISFYNDLPGDRKLVHVLVTGVEVSGFRHGVAVGGASGASGFQDVAVRSAKLHDNLVTGLLTYGPVLSAAAPTYANAGVRVSQVQAYRNVGDAIDRTHNTGSGIVLGSVQGGSVERSSAWANGSACRAPEGPVGIWTYDSDGVAIRGNISHDNRTGGAADGDGFDLDQNVSNSILERNLSYGNDGAGILMYTGLANGLHRGNVVRFNISQGDARSGRYGALTLWGRISDAQVYDNTVVALPNVAVRPPVVKLMPGLAGVAMRNNLLVSDGAGPLVSVPSLPAPDVMLQGNDYWATAGTRWQVGWGSSSVTSLDAWRAMTRQETFGDRATGLAVDPRLTDGHSPLRVIDPAALRDATGMVLSATSPLLGAGMDLIVNGIDAGTADYFGNPLPIASGPYDIGADHPTR